MRILYNLFRVGCIISSIALFTLGARQVHTESFYDSVVKVEGEFSGLRESTLRRHSTDYKISLKNHQTEYTILNFISPSFNKKDFIDEVKVGQRVSIYLEKKGSKSISQIKSNGKAYMSVTSRNNERKSNGIAGLIAGVIFLFIGIRMKN